MKPFYWFCALLVAVCLFMTLSGCSMSYDEVAAQEKWCTDRGMTPVRLTNLMVDRRAPEGSHRVAAVVCHDAKGSEFQPEEAK